MVRPLPTPRQPTRKIVPKTTLPRPLPTPPAPKVRPVKAPVLRPLPAVGDIPSGYSDLATAIEAASKHPQRDAVVITAWGHVRRPEKYTEPWSWATLSMNWVKPSVAGGQSYPIRMQEREEDIFHSVKRYGVVVKERS